MESEVKLIHYPPDLDLPYEILHLSEKDRKVIIRGTAQLIETGEGQFGGTEGTWRLRLEDLLTKQQRRDLGWIGKHQGKEARRRKLEQFVRPVVAAHTPKSGT